MRAIVNTYECEWKATLADPDKVRRFRPFINSELPDPSIVHLPLRQQHRVATWNEKAARLGHGA